MEVKAGWKEASDAIARVDELSGEGNVAGLIAELDNPLERGRYGQVRGHAARALGDVGDPHAVPSLLAHLDDPSEMMRLNVLDALGRIGSREAVPSAIERLRDESTLVRTAAAQALEQLNATDAIPVLRRTFAENEDDAVRWYAAKALVSLGDPSPRREIPSIIDALPWWARARRQRWIGLLDDVATPTSSGNI